MVLVDFPQLIVLFLCQRYAGHDAVYAVAHRAGNQAFVRHHQEKSPSVSVPQLLGEVLCIYAARGKPVSVNIDYIIVVRHQIAQIFHAVDDIVSGLQGGLAVSEHFPQGRVIAVGHQGVVVVIGIIRRVFANIVRHLEIFSPVDMILHGGPQRNLVPDIFQIRLELRECGLRMGFRVLYAAGRSARGGIVRLGRGRLGCCGTIRYCSIVVICLLRGFFRIVGIDAGGFRTHKDVKTGAPVHSAFKQGTEQHARSLTNQSDRKKQRDCGHGQSHGIQFGGQAAVNQQRMGGVFLPGPSVEISGHAGGEAQEESVQEDEDAHDAQ